MAVQTVFKLATSTFIDDGLRIEAARIAKAKGSTSVAFTRDGLVVEEWDIATEMVNIAAWGNFDLGTGGGK